MPSAVAPLPIREDWAPEYTKRRGHANRDFAHNLIDAQGMPGADGVRRHGAVDWYAPAGTPLVAPVAGTITRADRSTDTVGPVYGGVVQLDDITGGKAWVIRHVDPKLSEGTRVMAGDIIATVSNETGLGFWEHAHIERHIVLPYRYYHGNVDDLGKYSWKTAPSIARPVEYGFEELPWNMGGIGPGPVDPETMRFQYRWRFKAWRDLRYAALVAKHPDYLPRKVRFRDGFYGVVFYSPGLYAKFLRWRRFFKPAKRDAAQKAREATTGRKMRPFRITENANYSFMAQLP